MTDGRTSNQPAQDLPEAARLLLDFWFSPRAQRGWFAATPALDREIRERFLALWQAGAAGELGHWTASPALALALVIVLDQLPLNMFRGSAAAFSTEAAARQVARQAIDQGFDRTLSDQERQFIYLPFMHSEDLADQEHSVRLFESAAGLDQALHWARHHRDLIRRFGRFPHRNAALGRTSTMEELAYLETPGAFRG
jgi:uncharacterized protein (DUF924 family)